MKKWIEDAIIGLLIGAGIGLVAMLVFVKC